jgi:hypothetical protein
VESIDRLNGSLPPLSERIGIVRELAEAWP